MSAQTPPDDGFGLYLATIAGGDDDSDQDNDRDDDFGDRYRPRCGGCDFPEDNCECEGDSEDYADEADDAGRTGGDAPSAAQRDAGVSPANDALPADDGAMPAVMLSTID